ncbi:RhoGAP domain containing protein [Histomonas meleagridis]|uniref:RhoGAP domain containing protein n=1 Tax=Histomonas meleagridis TaxID=135588 RepID=UPI003559A195|nr:RhoGAP domain containing protein [Histomonas meleagridis]KAH0802554.1 RhoGAP domain containing protein [Histomonas meleagridis]
MVVFVQPLVELAVTNSKAIPPFLETSFRFLIDKGLDTKGIFRVSGLDIEINKFQSIIDATGDIVYPPDTTPFVVANLITRFIRLIPNHLMIDKYADSWSKVSTPEEAQKLFLALPLINKAVLARIIGFFVLVTRHKTNLMDTKALSIVLSPILISKPNDRMWLLPFHVIEIFLKDYEIVFGSMTSFDKSGNFMSADEFNSTIGDVCNQFFCQSTLTTPLQLKPLEEMKQCKLTRNLDIPKPEWESLFKTLLTIDYSPSDESSSTFTFQTNT